jgi:glycosyltransferase involved in cell wall biosynthesis
MTELPGVSIIVVNYNYGRFLAAAIDSALGQKHPLCEVIVVDDCSTDNSRAIIERYGHSIRSVLREANGHEIAASNSGWPLAHHPILMFLDADDLLLPHAAATVAGRWTAGAVKVQFPLVTIDKMGRQVGHVAPKYPLNLDTATIRNQLLRTGGSPNSPGSGNAYSRSLLDSIMRDGGFELDSPREHHMDAVLECNAPFFGDVVTIYEPLACYRIHGSNAYAINTLDHAHFTKLLNTFLFKLDYLAQRCRTWDVPFDPAAVCNRSTWPLDCRLAAAKLGSTEIPSPEPIFTTAYHAVKAHLYAPMPISRRIARTVWVVCVAVAPRPLARRLIKLRFIVTKRPRWFQRLFTKLDTWRGSPQTHATSA